MNDTFHKFPILRQAYLGCSINWGEWSNRLKCCEQIARLLVQTPLDTQLGSEIQPCYEAPGDLQVDHRQKCSD